MALLVAGLLVGLQIFWKFNIRGEISGKIRNSFRSLSINENMRVEPEHCKQL